MNHKTDIKTKLDNELKELTTRMKAIRRILNNTINFEDPKLLRKQLSIMRAYEEILKKRIENINKIRL